MKIPETQSDLELQPGVTIKVIVTDEGDQQWLGMRRGKFLALEPMVNGAETLMILQDSIRKNVMFSIETAKRQGVEPDPSIMIVANQLLCLMSSLSIAIGGQAKPKSNLLQVQGGRVMDA